MRTLLLLIALGFTVSCSDNSSDSTAPQPGLVNITTVTTGPQPDPDGYSIGLDGVDQGPIGLNETKRIENVDPGDHAVQLNGVESNCTVTGQNPRSVTLTSGGVVPVSFQVNCLGTLGGIQVTTETTGTSTDPDGYIVTLDGKDRFRIGTSDAATFSGLTPGAHEVGLEDVVQGCQVEGDNPRPVSVTGGATRNVSFRISCP
jgi:hypothetical protein